MTLCAGGFSCTLLSLPTRFAALALTFLLSCPAFAQDTNPLGQILGGIFGAIQKGAAKAEWQKLPNDILHCTNLIFKEKNASLETIIKKGVLPTDPRIKVIPATCQKILAFQLDSNVPCIWKYANGKTVQTTCDKRFYVLKNGQQHCD